MSMFNLTASLLTATADYPTILHPEVFHWLAVLISGQQIFETLLSFAAGSIISVIDNFNMKESMDIWKAVTHPTKPAAVADIGIEPWGKEQDLGYLPKRQQTSNTTATSASQFELFLSLTLLLSDLVFNVGSILVNILSLIATLPIFLLSAVPEAKYLTFASPNFLQTIYGYFNDLVEATLVI